MKYELPEGYNVTDKGIVEHTWTLNVGQYSGKYGVTQITGVGATPEAAVEDFKRKISEIEFTRSMR